MRGRKPKPTALKKLQGNPGKRKLDNNEPVFEVILPKCPLHMTGIARKEWNRISVILFNAGVVTEADLSMLEAYCVAYGRWVDAEKALKREGMTVMTTNGNVIQNPMLGIANRAMEQVRKLAPEFGLTPSSRSRLGTEQTDEVSLAEQLFSLVEGDE